MRETFKIFLLLALGVAHNVMAIEKPNYTVLQETETFEVRAYPELLVARTWVDAAFDKAGGEAFSRLGGYIFGDNAGDQKIAMTAPVMQAAEESGGGGYWVAFFMPAEYDLEALPKPVDEKVELVVMPASTVAVIRYRGGWSETTYREHEAMLEQALEKQTRWQIDGAARWARYNPPFMPAFLRSNEIMLPVIEVAAALEPQ